MAGATHANCHYLLCNTISWICICCDGSRIRDYRLDVISVPNITHTVVTLSPCSRFGVLLARMQLVLQSRSASGSEPGGILLDTLPYQLGHTANHLLLRPLQSESSRYATERPPCAGAGGSSCSHPALVRALCVLMTMSTPAFCVIAGTTPLVWQAHLLSLPPLPLAAHARSSVHMGCARTPRPLWPAPGSLAPPVLWRVPVFRAGTLARRAACLVRTSRYRLPWIGAPVWWRLLL